MTNCNSLPNCMSCGRFTKEESGASWRMVCSGYPPTPDHDEIRCKVCTEKYGPLQAQAGIKPEYGAGVFT
jgi:hypothetical protein